MERFEIGRDNLTLRGGLHPDSRDISKVESWGNFNRYRLGDQNIYGASSVRRVNGVRRQLCCFAPRL